MLTVFDLMTGETETVSQKPTSPRTRSGAPLQSIPYVMPRLQERVSTTPERPRDMPLELAQLDCELFIRCMKKR